MLYKTTTITISIARSTSYVYDYLVNPGNLTEWVTILGPSLRQVDDNEWISDNPLLPYGPLRLRFTPRNSFLVLDYTILLPGMDPLTTPVRLVPNGDGCDLIYVLQQRPWMSDEEFHSEVEWLRADVMTLKTMLENQR